MSQGYCKYCKGISEGQSRGRQFLCFKHNKYTKQSNDYSSNTEPINKVNFKSDGVKAEAVVFSEKPILTEEDALEFLNIDPKIWKVEKIEGGFSQGYRKDKQQDITWQGGKIADGSYSRDSGKMLVVQLHSFKVYLSRRTTDIRNELVLEDLVERAKKYAPKYEKLKYPSMKDGLMLEIGLPDLQLGRLVDEFDTGDGINPDLQIQIANKAMEKLMVHAIHYPISQILFPVGHDFFDTNSEKMETAGGTPQQDDIRWKRTYKLGSEFIVKWVEKLSQIAPVVIKMIPGNHDRDKVFHLGCVLEAWFHSNPNVTIDNSGKIRKYHAFGKNLLGLTHGYYEKFGKLDSLMAYEEPKLWANSTYREFHLGDLHHKIDMVLTADEKLGVVIRVLRSLARNSIWEYDHAFIGALRAAEAFLWHPNEGVIAQFTATGE